MPADEIIAFWLIPAGRERDYFASLITDLAARFDAPVFEPHVTLFGGKLDEQKAADILERCGPAPPIELEVERIDFSDKFTKTLFVQFRRSQQANELSAAIKSAAGIDSDYEFNPHLSLLYKEMPETEKAAAASSIAIPFRRVAFDALKAIATPAGIKSSEDVEAWRTVRERALGQTSG